MLPMNIIAGCMNPEMDWARQLAVYNWSLYSWKARADSS